MKSIKYLLCLVLLCTVAQGVLAAATAWAEGYNYVDANGTLKNTLTDGINGNDNPTVLTGSESVSNDGYIKLSSGWYVVNSNITYSHCIYLNGDVTIILANGKTMNVGTSGAPITSDPGIWGNSASALTIYGQSLDDAKAGTLNIFCNTDATDYHCIKMSMSYTQHSGNVYASNSGSGCAICTQTGFTMNGGKLEAITSESAIVTLGGAVTINGGEVTAKVDKSVADGIYADSSVTISGGKVTATGGGHGIWAGGSVTISGGEVTATGIWNGIYAYGTITLGWTNADDFVKASSYYRTVTIADGQAFWTDDATPQKISGNNISQSLINGKKLTPDVSSVFSVSSDGNTYTIWNTTGWNVFCLALEDYTTSKRFSGKTVTLGANIPTEAEKEAGTMAVTRMANQYFLGTFDGCGKTLTVCYGSAESPLTEQYVGPLRYMDTGSVVKGLVVEGDIYTSQRYAGGIVGLTSGAVSISNCRSSVSIHGSVEGEGKHGGLVGLNNNTVGSNLSIEGCTFTGKLLTTNGTNSCAGFVGSNGGTITITNSLYAPASPSEGETWVGSDGSATFARNWTMPDGAICYYTEALGTPQGTRAYTVQSGTEGLTLDYSGSATSYEYGGIKAYDYGLLYGDKLYTGATTSVTFTPEANQIIKTVKVNGTELPANSDGTYTMTIDNADVCVTAVLEPYTVILSDTEANTAAIEENKNRIANVTINQRTLFKDDKWNTICLPFDMTAEQVTAQLAPSELKELDVDGKYDGSGNLDNENGTFQTGFDDGTLCLYFKDALAIKAGVPYIIKWSKPSPYTAYDGTNASTCCDLVTPTFTGVTISSHAPEAIESADGKVAFTGCYDPKTIAEGGDNTMLYLGSGNQLYWPIGAMTFKPFRAYFQLNTTANVRVYHLNFGDGDETTGIVSIEDGRGQTEDVWYDLNGRKLDGKPTQKGVYINKDRKVVIK